MNRVFSRIRDHENIVVEGGNVQEVLERRKRGNDFDDVMEEDDEELLDYENYDFPTMPSEEDIQRAREIQPAVPYEEDEDDGEEEYDVEQEEDGEGEEEEGEEDGEEVEGEEDEEGGEDDEDMMLEGEDDEGEGDNDEEEEEGDGEEDDEDAMSEGNNYPSDDEDRGRDMNDEEYERLKSEAQRGSGKGRGRDNRDKKKIDLSRLSRQTLLFSATALETLEKKEAQFNRKQKPVKLQGTLKGLATGCSLPHNLKE